MSRFEKGNPRITLILLFLVFFLPVLFAYQMYNRADKLDIKTSEHGNLIRPAVSVLPVRLIDEDGKKQPVETLLGRWWLVDINADCDANCFSRQQMLNNVVTSLGRDQNRVSRLDVSLNKQKGYWQFNNNWRDVMTNNPTEGTFIIDPRGFVMMHYSPETDLKGIQADLKRLMSTSKIG